MMLAACGAVVAYPSVMKLVPLASTANPGGELGRRIVENAELMREYRGYVWSQWIRRSLTQLGTFFAVLLGTGGLLSHSSGSAALFTLSMPVSRNRLLGVRATTGLAELLAVAILPTLLISMLSPAVGQRYSVADAALHGVCFFVAGAAFFSLALLLSTIFSDWSRPILIACGVAVVLALFEQAVRGQWTYGIFRVMSGEDLFRSGRLPWLGLLGSAAVSAAMLFGATKSIARQEF
jgi:ABC-type transport system involved in multi-copper enzyme maturation permease subunit